MSKLRLALLIACAHTAGAQVTFETVLNELTDRDSLAIHPDGRYTQHQASSHDRRNALGISQLGAPWGFQNVDYGNYIRQVTIDGRTELVVMEDTGPGVLVRWWSTGINGSLNNSGRYRIYLDGSTTPVINATLNELLTGNNFGFGTSLNFGTPQIGGDLYGPIPYAQSIMVTWDGPTSHGGVDSTTGTTSTSNALWYNINYRKLAPGTSVTSFTTADTTTHAATVTATNNALSSPTATGHIDQQHVVDDHVLADGQSLSHALTGPGAIRRLMLNLNGSDQVAALKQTYVELIFDNQRTARVPAGHFFGNGGSRSTADPYNTFEDYWHKVEANGNMTCWWVMPFESAAEVRIVNESGQDVTVDLQVDSGNWTWDNDSMHLHANFREENNIQTRNAGGNYAANGDADWRLATLRGRGVYVGNTLSIRNRSNTGGNLWWGEGDEKIYLDYLDGNGDGAAGLPDHLGTGTEDYYGYSYGSGSLFASPFVSQPVADGNSGVANGLTVNTRVRGLDAVPFDSAFKFDLEIWKWLAGELDYDGVVLWYGRPGAVALETAADLATDFKSAANGQTASQAGITDTAGDGQWLYLASNAANPTGANTRDLTWNSVGNAGNSGYGDGQDGFHLAAISDEFLFTDGSDNVGINGAPGYNELALSPSGSSHGHVVARWVAGPSSAGLINVNGSVRNFVATGDSVDFAIFVNGVQKFSTNGSGTTLDETYFEFDTSIATGETVDFVLGNGGANNFAGDESLLRATILRSDFTPLSADQPVLSGATVTSITESTAQAQVQLGNSAADVTLFWDTQDNGTGAWPNSNALGAQSTGQVTANLPGLTADTRYFYRFQAVNTAPDPDLEAWSAAGRSFGTTFAAAQVVTSLTATAIDHQQINLTWAEAFQTETAFVIERSLTGTAPWTEVGTTAANTTAFPDTDLNGDTTYHYRVRARNESGDSAPSAVAQATTATPPDSKLVVVGDYPFTDNQAPAGFTTFGNPTYAAGKLLLDGNGDYLQAPAPTTATDNIVLEAIVSANAVGTFNFAASITNASGSNSGYGVLAQSGNWNALTSLVGFPGATPHGPMPTPTVAIAYVRDGGNSSLYVNGVKFDSGGGDNPITLTDAGVITIGGHKFDAPNGLFNGSIDRVRVSTFPAGEFDPDDLLGPGEGGEDFSSWIDGYDVGGQAGFIDDPDGDRITNGIENFFGTAPDATSPGLSTVTSDGTNTTFQHPQNPSLATDLTAHYEWSTDLVSFHPAGATVGGTTVQITPVTDQPAVGTTTVTAAVSGTIPGQLFVRVAVTQNA